MLVFFLLAWIVSTDAAWVSKLTQRDRFRSISMGGYYSEDKQVEDLSHTQMVFGVRCVETRVDNLPIDGCPSIISLQPDHRTNTVTEINLTRYLLTSGLIRGNTVLEVGAGLVSLACVRGGTSRVVACFDDEHRLQILKHAHLFWNPTPSQMCKFEQVRLASTVFPVVDIVAITDLGDSESAVLSYVRDNLTLQQRCRVLATESNLSVLESSGFNCRIIAEGVVEIVGSN